MPTRREKRALKLPRLEKATAMQTSVIDKSVRISRCLAFSICARGDPGSTEAGFWKTLIGLESGNIVLGAFTPVPAKHSRSFSLIDCISVGVDRMQRNFEPMRKQVEAWQRSKLADVTTEVL